MEIGRRSFTQLLGVMGLASVGKSFSQGKAIEVTMHNDVMPVFDPVNVKVRAGDTVRWINKGILVHTVTCDPKLAAKPERVALPKGVAPFASGDINQDDTYSHTFSAKGTYKYICKYHEEMGMVGTVTVL